MKPVLAILFVLLLQPPARCDDDEDSEENVPGSYTVNFRACGPDGYRHSYSELQCPNDENEWLWARYEVPWHYEMSDGTRVSWMWTNDKVVWLPEWKENQKVR